MLSRMQTLLSTAESVMRILPDHDLLRAKRLIGKIPVS